MKKFDRLISEAAAAASAGMHDIAEAIYRKVLKRDPANLDGHYLLGSLLAAKGDLPSAQKHLNIAATLNPASPYVWNNIGSLRRLSGDIDGAIAAWTRAIHLDPRLAEAWFGLGAIHHANGDFDKAGVCLTHAVDVKPSASGFSLLASISEKKGRLDDAMRYCRQALALQPDYGSAAFMLARLEGRPLAHQPGDMIRSLFDGYAANFDHHLLNDLAYSIPRLLAEQIRTHAGERRFPRIADLGCGTGLMGHYFPDASELVGIDLSPLMLAEARKKNCYSQLVNSDIVGYLATDCGNFDLFMAADVMIYIGALEETFDAVRQRSKPDTLFAFSTETTNNGDWELGSSSRYAQSPDYVRRCAERFGWRVISQVPIQGRTENGVPVPHHLHVLERLDELRP